MKPATPDRPRRWPAPMGDRPAGVPTPDLRPDRALPVDEESADAGERELLDQARRIRNPEAGR